MPDHPVFQRILTLDIGSLNTRAVLFTARPGGYELLGAGSAPTSLGDPLHNLRAGVLAAIEELQAVTGCELLDDQKNLVKPANAHGLGVDGCAVVVSAGRPLKVVTMGLSQQASAESAAKLARMVPCRSVETIGLGDLDKPDAVVDRLLTNRPDLVILAGGFEGGASQTVMRLLEPLQMAFHLLPEANRPEILFVGNQALQPVIRTTFKESDRLHCAANIRPAPGAEQLSPAFVKLSQAHLKILLRQAPGLKEIAAWADGHVVTAPLALSRLVRFLGKENPAGKGVLGVDAGAAFTTVIQSLDDSLSLGIFPNNGMSEPSDLSLEVVSKMARQWLARSDVTEAELAGYLFNQALFPASLPVTPAETACFDVLLRSSLAGSLQGLESAALTGVPKPGDGSLLQIEPILACGSSFAQAPSPGQACLALLDGLQPTGITTIVIDKKQLAGMLGAAAGLEPLLAVQLFDTDAFLHLCTVIGPLGDAPAGTPILRVRVTLDEGHVTTLDVRQGELEVIPLPPGQPATLHLQPFHRFDVGMQGKGRGGSLKVVGSALGVVIDARGRPLRFVDDPYRREELFRKWVWTLGG